MKKIVLLLIAAALLAAALTGCAREDELKLDPDNPVTITVWHYYNGALLNAFESAVTEFNNTVGMERGIIVDIYGFGNPNELEGAVMASAGNEIGSMPMPDIFASYADTALSAVRKDLLAGLSGYFTDEELGQYIPSYIEEGRIGHEGNLHILPVAKASEIMLINETDWLEFAAANNLTYDDIATMEGLKRVAEIYYNWTGGKAFFGRDSRANMFIIASKQFGTEIFEVDGNSVKININREVMRKIWDCYYIPYISGHYTSYGRFSSDDAKVGDILAYVGSTSSAAYFPAEVTTDRDTYPIVAAALPAPLFEGGERVMVQQGAGMVVTVSTPLTEYACAEFLKWFTDIPVNVGFASLSGYMPVKNDAMDYNLIKTMSKDAGIEMNAVTDATLKVAIDEISRSELYTSKAFTGGAGARVVLENHLQNKAIEDRALVLEMTAGGISYEEAIATLASDGQFEIWLEDLQESINDAVLNWE